MTIKIGLVVLTDLLCWMPIIFLGILVQLDKMTISPDIFAWIVAFVLPINSVINPLIYGVWHIMAWRRRRNIVTRPWELAGRGPRENAGECPRENVGGDPRENAGGGPGENAVGGPRDNAGGGPGENAGGSPGENAGRGLAETPL